MASNLLFLNQCFDKNRLKNLITWSLLTVGEKRTIETVENLKALGFQFATQAGVSLGVDDLKIPPEKLSLVSQASQQVAATQLAYRRGDLTAIEKLQQLVDTWHRTSETLKQTVVNHFQSTDKLSPVYMMAFSGARGNISQVRQLAGMRGLMADPQGQIIGFPIRSNFREGLTLTEYMISCYGARKGLVDTALRTADAGYLTRRLIDVSQHMIVKAATCATPRGIVLKDLQSATKVILPLRERLIGRVLAEDIVELPSTTEQSDNQSPSTWTRSKASPPPWNTPDQQSNGQGRRWPLRREVPHSPSDGTPNTGEAKTSRGQLPLLGNQDLLSETSPYLRQSPLVASRNQEISGPLASRIASYRDSVAVRSPLTCSVRHGVCQLCYGWSLSEGRLVTLGEAVGIIAAQSIGEPGTQLTMRTFHTGGVFSGDVMAEIRAPHDGVVDFPQPLQGLLIRTSHGRIAFLTKAPGVLLLGNDRSLTVAGVRRPPLRGPGAVGVGAEAPTPTPKVTEKEGTRFSLESLTVLFVRQHEKVARTQLLAEFSSMGTDMNETIEAKRTLFSEMVGQVSFANVSVGTRRKENGDILQVSRNLGFIWILSGRRSPIAPLLTVYGKGSHLVNQESLVARVASKKASQGFSVSQNGRNASTPSSMYDSSSIHSRSKGIDRDCRAVSKSKSFQTDLAKKGHNITDQHGGLLDALSTAAPSMTFGVGVGAGVGGSQPMRSNAPIPLPHPPAPTGGHRTPTSMGDHLKDLSTTRLRFLPNLRCWALGPWRQMWGPWGQGMGALGVGDGGPCPQPMRSNAPNPCEAMPPTHAKQLPHPNEPYPFSPSGRKNRIKVLSHQTNLSLSTDYLVFRSFYAGRVLQNYHQQERFLSAAVLVQNSSLLPFKGDPVFEEGKPKTTRSVIRQTRPVVGGIALHGLGAPIPRPQGPYSRTHVRPGQQNRKRPTWTGVPSSLKTPLGREGQGETLASSPDFYWLPSEQKSGESGLAWIDSRYIAKQFAHGEIMWINEQNHRCHGTRASQVSPKQKLPQKSDLANLPPTAGWVRRFAERVTVEPPTTGFDPRGTISIGLWASGAGGMGAVALHRLGAGGMGALLRMGWGQGPPSPARALLALQAMQPPTPTHTPMQSNFSIPAKSAGLQKQHDSLPSKRIWYNNADFRKEELIENQRQYFVDIGLEWRERPKKDNTNLGNLDGQIPGVSTRPTINLQHSSVRQSTNPLANLYVLGSQPGAQLRREFQRRGKNLEKPAKKEPAQLGITNSTQPFGLALEASHKFGGPMNGLNKGQNPLWKGERKIKEERLHELYLQTRPEWVYWAHDQANIIYCHESTQFCNESGFDNLFFEPSLAYFKAFKNRQFSYSTADNLLITSLRIQLLEVGFVEEDINGPRPDKETTAPITTRGSLFYQLATQPAPEAREGESLFLTNKWISHEFVCKSNQVSEQVFRPRLGGKPRIWPLGQQVLLLLRKMLWLSQNFTPPLTNVDAGVGAVSHPSVDQERPTSPVGRGDGGIASHGLGALLRMGAPARALLARQAMQPPTPTSARALLAKQAMQPPTPTHTPMQSNAHNSQALQKFGVSLDRFDRSLNPSILQALSRVRTGWRGQMSCYPSNSRANFYQLRFLKNLVNRKPFLWLRGFPVQIQVVTNQKVRHLIINPLYHNERDQASNARTYRSPRFMAMSTVQSVNVPEKQRGQNKASERFDVSLNGEVNTQSIRTLIEAMPSIERVLTSPIRSEFLLPYGFSFGLARRYFPALPQHRPFKKNIGTETALLGQNIEPVQRLGAVALDGCGEGTSPYPARALLARQAMQPPTAESLGGTGGLRKPWATTWLRARRIVRATKSSIASEKASPPQHSSSCVPQSRRKWLFGPALEKPSLLVLIQKGSPHPLSILEKSKAIFLQRYKFAKISMNKRSHGLSLHLLIGNSFAFATKQASTPLIWDTPSIGCSVVPVVSFKKFQTAFLPNPFYWIRFAGYLSFPPRWSLGVEPPAPILLPQRVRWDGAGASQPLANEVVAIKPVQQSVEFVQWLGAGGMGALLRMGAPAPKAPTPTSARALLARQAMQPPTAEPLGGKGTPSYGSDIPLNSSSFQGASSAFRWTDWSRSSQAGKKGWLSSVRERTVPLLSPSVGELVSQGNSLPKGRKPTESGNGENLPGQPNWQPRVSQAGRNVLFTQADYASFVSEESSPTTSVGEFVSIGDEIVAGYATPTSGQIVALEGNKITLRRTQALLFYAQGIMHVNHDEWVEKNAPILTLTYQKLVTGDIVQGIPKIEQFFEAPATKEGEPLSNSLQSRLRRSFQKLKQLYPIPLAVKKSLEEIQQILVEGILKVYLSQGVRIADKHLEIVIRQMISKGQVLDVGDTGLFQGEHVRLDRIERINLATYGEKADYEPAVLGITQASLDSDSFISAASFQETTRVLSRDTIIGKTDFLRGLKERVVLGDLIQAGTGVDDNINYGLLFGIAPTYQSTVSSLF